MFWLSHAIRLQDFCRSVVTGSDRGHDSHRGHVDLWIPVRAYGRLGRRFLLIAPGHRLFIGGAVGFVMIAPLSINKALLFLLFLIILLQLMANFIYPKVVGRSIGMPGIWVFTSVIIGAGLGGIGGVLLGVPLAATIYKILREQVNKRNAANKQASETSKVCSETSQNEENQQETIG